MENNNKKIIENKDFLVELEETINSGRSTDYYYDEELGEEAEKEVFDAAKAKIAVIELLKRYFI